MAELRLCLVDDVDEDEPLQVTIEDRDPFAVFKVDDQIFVTDDYCTHGKASLSDEGDLDGFTILCGWHDGSFDIRTGEVLTRPCTEPLRTYPVSVREGEIFISLEDD